MSYKVAFLGDVVLDETAEDKFRELEEYFQRNNINTCINLESPFVDENVKNSIKDKVCLRADTKYVNALHLLNPVLINLSNNHINDYGNASCELTFKILEENGLSYFGVGKEKERNNFVVNEEQKILYLAYTTRSADLTGEKLFAKGDFIGGYDVDRGQITKLKEKYPTYTLIVNIHWGIEDVKYPEPEKRTLARQIIDCGADLIIGHHPHIIQPYEIYKGKYIYYSIGNFYFPKINYLLSGKIYEKKPLEHQKKGIVPVFVMKKGVFHLENTLFVKNEQNFSIKECYNHKQLRNNEILYNVRYKCLYYWKVIGHYSKSFLIYAFTDPQRIFRAIKKRIQQ